MDLQKQTRSVRAIEHQAADVKLTVNQRPGLSRNLICGCFAEGIALFHVQRGRVRWRVVDRVRSTWWQDIPYACVAGRRGMLRWRFA